MTKEQLIELLKNCQSEQQWNETIDNVIKPAFDGQYPEWCFF